MQINTMMKQIDINLILSYIILLSHINLNLIHLIRLFYCLQPLARVGTFVLEGQEEDFLQHTPEP